MPKAERRPRSSSTSNGVQPTLALRPNAEEHLDITPKEVDRLMAELLDPVPYTNPSLFVEVGDAMQHRPLRDILDELAVARAERERADTELTEIRQRLLSLGSE